MGARIADTVVEVTPKRAMARRSWVASIGIRWSTRRGFGAIGAVVARFVHTEEVTGSNPVSPLSNAPGRAHCHFLVTIYRQQPRWSTAPGLPAVEPRRQGEFPSIQSPVRSRERPDHATIGPSDRALSTVCSTVIVNAMSAMISTSRPKRIARPTSCRARW